MPTKEQRIALKRERIQKLNDRIGALMSQRADLEEQLADLLPKVKVGNPAVGIGQPWVGSQMVILEKRKPDWSLDFSPPQPPTEAMTFDALYSMYFRESSGGGTWAELREWLESKSWIVRAKTW